MRVSTPLAFIALFYSYVFVAASSIIRARGSPINDIQIEIESSTLTIVSGTTTMGLAPSHHWGPDVLGNHSLITIAGLGEPDTPWGWTAKAEITMQSLTYKGSYPCRKSPQEVRHVAVHGTCTMTFIEGVNAMLAPAKLQLNGE
ncbi:uncharacterized protein MKK02DRAFT_40614 [Dioszegia hungarica]|uniref:Uncharacterized protein n=1 Tax=Dioszegia hungarica TaxID=4972 RepID=A0AA38LT90_9TREE|nr:uncharacterized protein MKK02DRAFT_40614 [Dioszegia hungarica]KAI9632311.1 hypothetical protein MKK02DRAFT_40614 [Dioszegia hungarica]